VKRVVLLGSTGSIGVQALDVISRDPELCVVGLSCGRQADVLLEQAVVHGVTEVAIADEHAGDSSLALYPELRVRRGVHAAAHLVRDVECDLVLNAIVGFAGLESTVAALEDGRPLALANKESLVSGGRVVTALAARTGVRILPVDSEHSALFQLLAGEDAGAIGSVVLTASGGPFRGRTAAQLADVEPGDALAHPTWDMGAKISIDSATLMNKGLEVIEAHHLFALPYDRIEVVVHPQSLVHALVRLVDGALLAHLGAPDMRVPIGYALRYPRRASLPVAPLDLVAAGRLDFLAPDPTVFRCLTLARQAGLAGDAATCALNAANEVAVHAFLDRRLPFLGIGEVVERVLGALAAPEPQSYDEVVAVDEWARRMAAEVCASPGVEGSC
jgi:1-deoxy-D-xylulose-5-phosphate reductoisomerase